MLWWGLDFVICGCCFCEFSLLQDMSCHAGLFYSPCLRKQLGVFAELTFNSMTVIFWLFYEKWQGKVPGCALNLEKEEKLSVNSICRLTCEISCNTLISVAVWGLVLDSLQCYLEQISRWYLSAVFYRSLVNLLICKPFSEFYRTRFVQT